MTSATFDMISKILIPHHLRPHMKIQSCTTWLWKMPCCTYSQQLTPIHHNISAEICYRRSTILHYLLRQFGIIYCPHFAYPMFAWFTTLNYILENVYHIYSTFTRERLISRTGVKFYSRHIDGARKMSSPTTRAHLLQFDAVDTLRQSTFSWLPRQSTYFLSPCKGHLPKTPTLLLCFWPLAAHCGS